ncbi:hypothetical protein PVAND_010523 [Polypedilum vanderplanki]|uniref:Uncharacterized protein n=1 Tax=Polypedilum vanderplanki TaxID=319348 RepID=A0A9J6CFU0_POLVA|nr:hypothetical protein PVAND_010523 [Polypedilum vanderplanki]
MDNSVEFYEEFNQETPIQAEQPREISKLPYSCAACQHITELNKYQSPACENCGHNILYKTRNKKFALVFDGR